jgi:hypothetical protein
LPRSTTKGSVYFAILLEQQGIPMVADEIKKLMEKNRAGSRHPVFAFCLF